MVLHPLAVSGPLHSVLTSFRAKTHAVQATGLKPVSIGALPPAAAISILRESHHPPASMKPSCESCRAIEGVMGYIVPNLCVATCFGPQTHNLDVFFCCQIETLNSKDNAGTGYRISRWLRGVKEDMKCITVAVSVVTQ